MSEKLPSQQNEPQAWKLELRPHPESSGTLTKGETLALMGSWVEESFEGATELHESGTTGDIEFSVQKRIKEAATSELSLLDVEDQSVFSAIAERQRVVEEQLYEKGANRLMIRAKLDGLSLLEETYKNIEDHVGSPLGDRHTRAAAINEMIDSHNEWVARNSETTASSPEIREAQERINARYAEQAKQPQPTETVDDARQKVAEAFGDTSEKEHQALMGEVARAAKGTTSIHTDVPAGFSVPAREGAGRGDGFTSFGDGTQFNNMDVVTRKTNLQRSAESPETIIFKPDTTTEYKTVIKTVETGGRFRKKTEQIEEQVPSGEVPIMVTNPATGQQEPGVKVAYLFNGNGAQYSLDGNPPYLTKSGRSGNQLYVESTLPKSIAEQLSREVADKPELAREYAETLVLNNGIPQELWDSIVRPPYNKLSSDWKITVANQ